MRCRVEAAPAHQTEERRAEERADHGEHRLAAQLFGGYVALDVHHLKEINLCRYPPIKLLAQAYRWLKPIPLTQIRRGNCS